ncbi:MAG TPA: CBS domain-containing protein [Polyangia bacterium]
MLGSDASVDGGRPRAALGVSPVGRRASRHFWWARAEETCAAALDRLRTAGPGAQPAPVHYCYVVDAADQLVGSATVAAVLAAAADVPLKDVMSPRVIPIPEGAPEEAIQDFFITYGLLAFPVVDRGGKLVGVVGVEHFSDLVFEGFDTQVREETYRSVGLTARDLEEPSVASAARARLPWLGVTLAGGVLAALLLGQAALEPAAMAAIGVFLPLVVMLAERVTLRTIALRGVWSAGERHAHALLRRELAAAALLAFGLGPLTGGVTYLWRGQVRTALAVGLATLATILVGTGVGLLAPVGERGGKAARVGAPIALAVAGVAAVGIILAVARLLMLAGSH